MATFKNISGGPLDIPALDLHIAAAATFTVDDAAADGFRSQPVWQEATPAKNVAATPAANPITPATPTDAPAVVTEIGA